MGSNRSPARRSSRATKRPKVCSPWPGLGESLRKIIVFEDGPRRLGAHASYSEVLDLGGTLDTAERANAFRAWIAACAPIASILPRSPTRGRIARPGVSDPSRRRRASETSLVGIPAAQATRRMRRTWRCEPSQNTSRSTARWPMVSRAPPLGPEVTVMRTSIDAVLKVLADVGWRGFQAVNERVEENASPSPEWAPRPLLKSRERSRPPLGWPRETDSLCPRCVIETRNAILSGERDLADLVDGHVGEVKARIQEERRAPHHPQDVPGSRDVRGPSLDRPRVQPTHRGALPGAGLPDARRRADSPARDVHDQVRARRRAHDRSRRTAAT